MSWKVILMLALLLIAIIFTIQNYEAVGVKFFFWTFTASRALVLFLTLCVGIIIGWIAALVTRKK